MWIASRIKRKKKQIYICCRPKLFGDDDCGNSDSRNFYMDNSNVHSFARMALHTLSQLIWNFPHQQHTQINLPENTSFHRMSKNNNKKKACIGRRTGRQASKQAGRERLSHRNVGFWQQLCNVEKTEPNRKEKKSAENESDNINCVKKNTWVFDKI